MNRIARQLGLAAVMLLGIACHRQRPAGVQPPVARDTIGMDSITRPKIDSTITPKPDSIPANKIDSVSPQDSVKSAPNASSAKKQGRPCTLDFVPARRTDSLRIFSQTLPSGNRNVFIGGGVLASCRGQQMTLQADSAEHYGDQDLLYLIGTVKYREERVRLDAERMTYWRGEEHILAEGNVFAITPKGATMRGPMADYYRAVENLRPEPTLNATGRPRLAMPQRDSVTGEVKDTIHMVADRIYSVNDSLVYAGGNVNITRTELLATSDSAFMDQGSGRAQLLVEPVVNAKQKDRPFTLKGGVIDMFSKNREIDRIVATPDGHATSKDLELFADSIDMRITNRQLNRAMAWGKKRARAISPQHDILADSIDAILPNQRIRELHAIRKAFAQTAPDTTVITTTEKDWMRGDTIIAYFDTTPPPPEDTSGTPPIRNILARVEAQAFYHIKNNDGAKDKPGINYVRGREITIDFLKQEVQTVTVVDQASGVYLEAVEDSTARRQPITPDTVPVNPVPSSPNAPVPSNTPQAPVNSPAPSPAMPTTGTRGTKRRIAP